LPSKYLIAFLLFLASYTAEAQVSDTIKINGTVLDIYEHTPVSGVSVIIPKSGQSFVTDATGKFTVTCHKRDTLFLFLYGYQTLRFSMADSVMKTIYHPVFQFDRLLATLSRPIIVHPKKDLNDIGKEREKIGQIPKELRQPDVPLTSPISALYELLSDRAKERTKLREQMQADERSRIYRELFDYYKEAGLFDLPDEYYDQFINYLNLPVDFLRKNTDYTITKTIMDSYKKFGLEKGFMK
jgi:CarboxypepD_reg-like domain